MNGPLVVTVRAGEGGTSYLRSLWRHRELMLFLAWRDILVRYKQTALGVAWAIIRPVLLMVVFSALFGKMAGLPSDGVPYPLLVYAGLLPWQLFASALADGSLSLLANPSLITKVYFPRLVLPLGSLLVALVDFVIAFVVYMVLWLVHGMPISWHVALLPAFVLLACITALAGSVWLSALVVRFRDIRHIVPFILQIGMLVSPVGFSASVVPEGWARVYALNPMVPVIQGFRWCLLPGQAPPDGMSLMASCALVGLLLATGVRFFRSTERGFADVI